MFESRGEGGFPEGSTCLFLLVKLGGVESVTLNLPTHKLGTFFHKTNPFYVGIDKISLPLSQEIGAKQFICLFRSNFLSFHFPIRIWTT